jgi:glycosyltransferase involved in cell wall biosynthesis
MMKIAFINQPWTIAAPSRGGDSIGIWTYQVARRLASQAEITVYGAKSSDRADYLEEGIRYRGVTSKIDKLLTPLRILDRWGISNPKRPIFASGFYYGDFIQRVAKELSQQSVDIIHIHNFSYYVPIARRFNPKAKIVIHMHCEWLTQLDADLIAKRICDADSIVGCSEYITDKVCQKFPQLADRTQTIFNGVDTSHFVGNDIYNNEHNPEQPNILFVGRISPEKGIHVLIDAFKEVVKRYPQASLNIVGSEAIAAKELIINISDEPHVTELASFFPGSYLEKLKSQIPSDLAKQINFVGGTDQEKLLKYYWDADILVNPSLSEAFGMSLAEAMATHLPVIGARVGGMISVIDEGKTGLLVEPANPSALAKAILDLLGDRELRKQMGIAGNRRVKELFSWDKISEDLLSRYQKMLAAE